MDFGNLDFKDGRGVPSEKYGYKLRSSRDVSVDYFACWPNIDDVIKCFSDKSEAIDIINACALKEEHKLKQNHGLDGSNGPNGSDVPGFYGNHYSWSNGLIPAVHETTRLDSVFFLKLAAVLSTLGVAGLIVIWTSDGCSSCIRWVIYFGGYGIFC